MADFTSRFNELLTRHEGNDTDLGVALGVSKQTISAWRTGTRSPKKPHIVAIAKYFNVGIAWLMGISDYESDTIFDSLRHGLSPSPELSCMLREVRDSLPDGAASDPGLNELLRVYDGLNRRGRDNLLNYARYLSGDPEMKQDGASNGAMA